MKKDERGWIGAQGRDFGNEQEAHASLGKAREAADLRRPVHPTIGAECVESGKITSAVWPSIGQGPSADRDARVRSKFLDSVARVRGAAVPLPRGGTLPVVHTFGLPGSGDVQHGA